ncbi:immunity 49 family protein [Streptomyces halstedii]|uniref:immunity 49 family protein n=1 Tax=Streptomyces halstedii TaxID=1944 RepID=UPI0037F47BFD
MKAVEGKHAYAGAVPEYSWVEALQNFWLRRVDVSRHLVRAIDLSAPEGARILDAETMGKLEHPAIMIFYRYLCDDAAGFNEALHDALRRHKEYWTANEDRTQNSKGPGRRPAGGGVPREDQRHCDRGRVRLPA